MQFVFCLLAILQLAHFQDKSMVVLRHYHREFSSCIRSSHVTNALGPWAIDFSNVTLCLEEEEKIQHLVMRKRDLRWNYVYLAASTLFPSEVEQTFANAFALFRTFEEMLRFRVGSIYYKYKNKNETLSEQCSRMATYLSIYGSILLQDRVFEARSLKERMGTSFFGYNPIKPNTGTGKDSFTAAQNLEIFGEISAVLSEIMDGPSLVRKQYPLRAANPEWVFAQSGKQMAKRPVDLVKATLARDFFIGLPQQPQPRQPDQAELSAPQSALARFEIEEEASEIASPVESEKAQLASQHRGLSKGKAPVAVTDTNPLAPPQKQIASKKTPSEEEKEEMWLKHVVNLPMIDEKYKKDLKEEDDPDEFYCKCAWNELFAMYGDTYKQVKEYFDYAVMDEPLQQAPPTFYERSVPKLSESRAVWQQAEFLIGLTEAEYKADEAEPKSNPVAVLQHIERTVFGQRAPDDANFDDQSRLSQSWRLKHVDPTSYTTLAADLQLEFV